MEILIILACVLGLITLDKKNKEYEEMMDEIETSFDDRLNKIEAELEDIRHHLMFR